MVELEHVQKREVAEERIKPAALPARPPVQEREDILEQFKRESAAITGSNPTRAQVTKHFDDYARQAILRVAETRDGQQWNRLLESFSDNALRAIHQSDPLLAIEISKSRDNLRSLHVATKEVIEKHGSLEKAAFAFSIRSKNEEENRLAPEKLKFVRSLQQAERATYAQLTQLQRVAMAPAND